jgi:hypothetical protein
MGPDGEGTLWGPLGVSPCQPWQQSCKEQGVQGLSPIPLQSHNLMSLVTGGLPTVDHLPDQEPSGTASRELTGIDGQEIRDRPARVVAESIT